MNTMTQTTGAAVGSILLVWGWYANHPVRETFTTKRAAWERVQQIMSKYEAPWMGAPKRHVALLEVYTTDEKGRREVTTFNRFEKGSKYCRWGQWGASKCSLMGALCG